MIRRRSKAISVFLAFVVLFSFVNTVFVSGADVFELTVIGALGDKTEEGPHEAGATVTSLAATTTSIRFVRWSATGTTLTDDQKKANPLEFTMPGNDVELTAYYEYQIAVSGGTASPTFAEPGTGVTVTATVQSDKEFVKWVPATGTSLPGSDLTSNPLKFNMPATPVSLTAEFKDKEVVTHPPLPIPPAQGQPSTPPSTPTDPGGPGTPPVSQAPELPVTTVTPSAPSEEEAELAADAVEAAAEAAADRSGATVKAAGPAISVHIPKDEPTVVKLASAAFDYSTSGITTMAILNEDGSLTPVPTRVTANGDVVVMLTEDAVLVPLNVQASFSDLVHVAAHVSDEIKRAASLMVVEGYPDGTFHPGQQVTVQEAVTMFLRASGVPVEWASAMDTGVDSGFIGSGAIPTDPMSRIAAAQLIVDALGHFDMKFHMEAAEISSLLAPFDDLGGLSGPQREAMAACVKVGIFKGMNANTMNPGGVLNRSQMASLAVRLQDVFLGLN